jgi:ABC-type transporter Mla MlaB component
LEFLEKSKLMEETEIKLKREKKWNTITPSGSLNPSAGEKLRTLLMELYDEGGTSYRFDFKHTEDIDPVCLYVLLRFGQMVKDKGNSNLEIKNVNQDLNTLFQMTAFGKFYRIGEKRQ